MLERALAGFDLREIENVIQDREQGERAIAHRARHLPLLTVERGLAQ